MILMIRKLLFVIVAFSFSATAFGERPLSNTHKAGLEYDSIETILELPDKDIDLATALLTLSSRWNVYTNTERYRREIDDIAWAIRDALKEKRAHPGRETIAVINEYLFDNLGFSPVKTAENPQDLFLDSVMDNKRGYCLSLSVLYLSIGERLGLPLHGVVVPGHFFVRHGSERGAFNIETTQNGGFASDSHYIKDFNVPKGGKTIYMKNLTKKQTIGCFFNNLGNIYSDDDDIENAFYYLQMAVKINPKLSEARTNLANIYSEKNMFDEAIALYKTAIEINPYDSKTYYNLANAYRKTNKFDLAIKHYRTAISMDDDYVESYKGLAQSYYEKKLYRMAIETFEKAVALDSTDANIYADIAMIYYEQKNYPEAISSYRLAVSIQPDHVRALYGLAQTYLQNEMLYDAIEQFRAVTYYDPQNADAYFALGIAYNKLGWADDEIDAYDNAIAIEPAHVGAHQNIAKA